MFPSEFRSIHYKSVRWKMIELIELILNDINGEGSDDSFKYTHRTLIWL